MQGSRLLALYSLSAVKWLTDTAGWYPWLRGWPYTEYGIAPFFLSRRSPRFCMLIGLNHRQRTRVHCRRIPLPSLSRARLLSGGVCILNPGTYPSLVLRGFGNPAPLSEAKAKGGMAFLASGVGKDATTTIHRISKDPCIYFILDGA